MIRFLCGKVIDNFPTVVAVGGVGYEVNTPADFAIGSMVEVWTHHFVREDRNELYGFKDKNDLRLFELLIDVSGVGPKVALSICRGLTSKKIEEAIIGQDVQMLTTVPGLGKKLAQKIIIELKSKLEKTGAIDFQRFQESSEVADALKSLGYLQKEIYGIIKKIPSNLSSTEQISWALRNIKK